MAKKKSHGWEASFEGGSMIAAVVANGFSAFLGFGFHEPGEGVEIGLGRQSANQARRGEVITIRPEPAAARICSETNFSHRTLASRSVLTENTRELTYGKPRSADESPPLLKAPPQRGRLVDLIA